jgi:ribonuclease Z
MAKLVILGTAKVADAAHENTHMAVVGNSGAALIDCVGTPIVRLEKAGITLDQLDDVILTHFHPDHVSGIPLLLMDMWLMGRQKPLRIYGLHHTLERIEDLMSFYRWDNWPQFFPVAFHRLPERDQIVVLENGEYRILSSPVRHVIPTIGLRFESQSRERIIAYSCDTEPCQSVVHLAQGADILIHEASGASVGHSSASQAGSVAQEADVGQLLLIHYPTREGDTSTLLEQARETFSGEVGLAVDLMEIEL